MRFTISREKLLEATAGSHARPFSSETTLPVLANLLIEEQPGQGIRLSVTNLVSFRRVVSRCPERRGAKSRFPPKLKARSRA
jgi:DNA polymerase III sliding clamp (beta) subunit (PCNA family)